MEKHANVDKWLAANPRWRAEAKALRPILLDCGLSEAVKWGKPCYGHVDNNIAIVQSFKGFLALLFVKGILLEAPEGVLESQGKNTHSSRRVCFRSTDDVKRLEPTLRDLVRQAVAVEDAGTPLPEREALVLVAELQARLDADPTFKAAFEALTPGRQRGYHLHISDAKQSKTRAARVDKLAPRILAGKGLRDR